MKYWLAWNLEEWSLHFLFYFPATTLIVLEWERNSYRLFLLQLISVADTSGISITKDLFSYAYIPIFSCIPIHNYPFIDKATENGWVDVTWWEYIKLCHFKVSNNYSLKAETWVNYHLEMDEKRRVSSSGSSSGGGLRRSTSSSGANSSSETSASGGSHGNQAPASRFCPLCVQPSVQTKVL